MLVYQRVQPQIHCYTFGHLNIAESYGHVVMMFCNLTIIPVYSRDITVRSL